MGFTTFSSWPVDAYALLGWHPPWLKITHQLCVDDSQTIWWAQLPQPKILNHLPNIFPAIYWGVWRQLKCIMSQIESAIPAHIHTKPAPSGLRAQWCWRVTAVSRAQASNQKAFFPLIPQISQVCSFSLVTSCFCCIPETTALGGAWPSFEAKWNTLLSCPS